jgi:hypothetical protein
MLPAIIFPAAHSFTTPAIYECLRKKFLRHARAFAKTLDFDLLAAVAFCALLDGRRDRVRCIEEPGMDWTSMGAVDLSG